MRTRFQTSIERYLLHLNKERGMLLDEQAVLIERLQENAALIRFLGDLSEVDPNQQEKEEGG